MAFLQARCLPVTQPIAQSTDSN